MFGRRPSPAKKKFATVPPAAKKRRRPLDPRTVVLIKQALIGTGLILLLGLCVTTVWYVTRLPALTITTVTASGGETIDADVVIEKVDTVLAGTYLGIVPRRFTWWYPEDELITAVKSVPRLKDPVITKVSLSELAITYDEYIPYALWCDRADENRCIFVDEAGYAFTPAPQLLGGSLPRYTTIGRTPEVGQLMIALDDLQAIELLRTEIDRELRLPVVQVETDIARDVFFTVSGGGEIKATLRMTPQETFDNLRTILLSDEFKDLAPGEFQYIDLRFGNKVFVNEEDPNLATTTVATSSDMTVASTSIE